MTEKSKREIVSEISTEICKYFDCCADHFYKDHLNLLEEYLAHVGYIQQLDNSSSDCDCESATDASLPHRTDRRSWNATASSFSSSDDSDCESATDAFLLHRMDRQLEREDAATHGRAARAH